MLGLQDSAKHQHLRNKPTTSSTRHPHKGTEYGKMNSILSCTYPGLKEGCLRNIRFICDNQQKCMYCLGVLIQYETMKTALFSKQRIPSPKPPRLCSANKDLLVFIQEQHHTTNAEHAPEGGKYTTAICPPYPF